MSEENKMFMAVNGWSVDWREDGKWKEFPCALEFECGGAPTRGAAHFKHHGQSELVAGGGTPPCCKRCAIAYVMREGLKNVITVRSVRELLERHNV